MKNSILIFVLLVSTSLSFAQDWVTYSNDDFKFSIDMPSEPKATTQEVPTEVGELTMNMFMLDNSSDASSKNMIYMVLHTKYPKNANASDEDNKTQTMLDGSVDGAVNNVNGKLVYANKVNLDGHPGREVKISVFGAFMYLNMYVKDGALFAIQTICMEANDENVDIKKFMDSFKFK